MHACIACDESLGRDLPLEEEKLPVFMCGAYDIETPPLYEHVAHAGDVSVLNCSNQDCDYLVAAVLDNGVYKDPNVVPSAEWIEENDEVGRCRVSILVHQRFSRLFTATVFAVVEQLQ
jgi:hypothetical protein